jgi:hypothetical protein
MTLAARLSASQIKDRIEKMMMRHGYRCDCEELEAVYEAIRRVEEHELVMQKVSPDIQNRRIVLEAAASNEKAHLAHEPRTDKEVRQDGPHLHKSRRPSGVGQRAK